MFTHKVQINTVNSMDKWKLDLVDNDMRVYDSSNESLIFCEKLFWTKTFLHPIVKCNKKEEGILELCFCLRKIDKILLLLYFITGCIISLFTMVMGEMNELPFVIVLWLSISLLLFGIYFKHNCKRITKKIVSLQK